MNLFWKRVPKTAKFEQQMADSHEMYLAFEKTKNSEQLKEYQDLKEIDFTQAKHQYKGDSEYKESPLYQKEQRFALLSEHTDIKNYLLYEKSDKLDFYKRFEQVRFDEFAGNNLDTYEWASAYRWSHEQIKGNYSTEDEYQGYTEGRNTHVVDGQLQIVTKRDDIKARMWHSTKGFVTKDYKFSSDLITGRDHLSSEGCVMIKFKVEGARAPLQHFIRAYDAKSQRCITIMESLSKRKFMVGRSSVNNGKKTALHNQIRGLNLEKDFHILDVEWNNEVVSWKINGLLIHQENKLEANSLMHIAIGTHVTGAKGGEGKLIVDYIRYFKRK